MSKLWLEKKNFYLGEEGDQGVPFQKKVFPMYSNQLMDSRNVNFSIKKSQIHTHMLGLPQKLTKLEIALKTSIALDLGLVPKNWPWNKLLFTLFTAKAPPGGHWWNRGLGPKFTNEVLTYLIKKNLIKITLTITFTYHCEPGIEPFMLVSAVIKEIRDRKELQLTIH